MKNAFASVNIVPAPQVLVSASASTICMGENAIIDLSGANVFTILPNIGVAQLGPKKFKLSPPATTNYTITGQNQCGTASSNFTLNVLPNSGGVASGQICQGESYAIGGQTFTSTGVYQVPFTAFNGCDSVITLTLTVGPVIETTLNETVCFGESFEVGGQSFSTSGTYQIPFVANNGCDSLITLHLTALPPLNVPSIGLNGINELACNTFAQSYTWFLNGLFYLNTNSQSIIVSQNGSYTVQYASFDGCSSPISSPYLLNSVGTQNVLIPGIIIFPNPTNGMVYIEHPVGVEIQITVTMLDGRQIESGNLKGDKIDQIDLTEIPSGLYLITVKYSGGVYLEKLVRY